MIQTDKYKRGVIALARKAAEINPTLGEYQSHYLNERAKFIVQLSNGKLEVDIDMARDFENNQGQVREGKLKKLAVSSNGTYKTSIGIDTIWRRLFLDDKYDTSI